MYDVQLIPKEMLTSGQNNVFIRQGMQNRNGTKNNILKFLSFYFVDLNIFALLPEVYLALLLFWMHQFQITIVSTWALVFVMCPFNATFQIYFYTSYVIMVSAYFYIMFKEFSWFTKCLIHRQIFKVGDKFKLLCKLKEKIIL